MPEELMIDTIEGLKNCGGFETVGFSGGEPFLYPDLLKKGILRAKEAGFYVTVISNGFWGAWSDGELRNFFNEARPDSVGLSTDSSHARFVPDGAFARAVAILQILDIDFRIMLGENKTGLSAKEHFDKMGVYKYSPKMQITPHVRAGRAADFPEDAFYRYKDPEKAACNAQGIIAVRYDGEILPCCSPYICDTRLTLGNIREKNINEILSDKNNNYIFASLLHGALPYLASLAKERYNIRFPEVCTDGCEVCARLFGDGEHFTEWLREARNWYTQFATDRLLGKNGEKEACIYE
jgi:MoaA/NifB/PqqE/SkfB family radical SAM enzyme